MSALPERTTGSASRRDGPIGEEAWSPEVVLSCAQARALIEPQFPEFLGSEQDASDAAARAEDLSARWCSAKRSGAWKSTNGAFFLC